MAFGKKQARIEQLTEEARMRDAESSALAPFIGIAQEIRARVNEVAVATGNFDAAFTETISKVTREKKFEAAVHIATSLPPVAKLELLHATYGDEELKQALQELREKELKRTTSGLSRKELRDKVQATGTLSLLDFKAGESLTFDLCKPTVTPYERKNYPHQHIERSIAGLALDGGELHVTSDSTGEITDHEIIKLGTIVSSGSERAFRLELHKDTTIALVRGGKSEVLPVDLMQVTVDNDYLINRFN